MCSDLLLASLYARMNESIARSHDKNKTEQRTEVTAFTTSEIYCNLSRARSSIPPRLYSPIPLPPGARALVPASRLFLSTYLVTSLFLSETCLAWQWKDPSHKEAHSHAPHIDRHLTHDITPVQETKGKKTTTTAKFPERARQQYAFHPFRMTSDLMIFPSESYGILCPSPLSSQLAHPYYFCLDAGIIANFTSPVGWTSLITRSAPL